MVARVFRALNPRWAADPLSGDGAALHGGQFNVRGTPALYTALLPETALREANQIGSLQPTLLVEYAGATGRLLDGRVAERLAPFGATPEALADRGWRQAMIAHGTAPTQDLAARLIAAGYDGLLVPSYARGAAARDINLVLWRWPDLRVIDDDSRLDALRS